MCDDMPDISSDIIENIGYIATQNKKYEYKNINKNDFFLLLLEYLEKNTCDDIFLPIKFIKKINETSTEKICKEFIKDCIKKSNGREKCNDVYDKYVSWSINKGFDTPLSRIKLFAECKKHMAYKKSARYGDTFTSVFSGITLK
jgi:hypothetical protein